MSLALARRVAAGAAVVVFLVAPAPAQPPAGKKILTPAEYDIWKTATGVTLSRDGKYVAYTVGPADGPGDTEVVVRHVASGKETRIARGGRPAAPEGVAPEAPTAGPAARAPAPAGSPQFSPDSARLVFALTPTKAELDAAKGKADQPRPVLAVLDLATGKVTDRLSDARAFVVGGDGGGYVVYHKAAKIDPKDGPPAPTPTPGGTKFGPGGGGKFGKFGGGATPGPNPTAPAPAPARPSDLVIRNLASGMERTVADVSDYSLSKDGKTLVYIAAAKSDAAAGVFATDPRVNADGVAVKAGAGKYSRLAWDEKQTKLAFFYDAAGVSADPKVAPPPRPVGWTPAPTPADLRAYVWDRGGGAAVEVVGPATPGLKAGWVLSANALGFSADGSRLYVATNPRRAPAPPAPTTPAPKGGVELDLWHWKDGYIQPMQKIRGDVDKNKTFAAVAFLDTKQFRQLGDESLTVGAPAAGDWALGTDDKKYLHLTGYVNRVPRDYTLVNVRTGEKRTVLTGFDGTAGMSPDGKHLLGFDGKDWFTVRTADGTKTNITGKVPTKFFNEEDDHPDEPPPHGSAGWTTDGRHVLLYDRYDLWKVAADGSGGENLTKTGRGQQVRFRRLAVPVDEDEGDAADRRGIDLTKSMLLAAENLDTRDSGYFRLDPGAAPKQLVMGARKYGAPTKAKAADVYLFTAQSFAEYPDYHASGADFQNPTRVTDINPHVKDYNWGRAELVRYKSSDGVPLSGVLVKPENFDPTKKYPLVVYIYERLSDTLHGFRTPNVLRGQVINPTFYASNGYLVLMPDITYKVGSPGQSAIKCVLPAIQAVVEKGCVDEAAIGINGQSWGGYQIAYMVTQTNRFKAAVAGAPVSNMVSAYNGIRWGTGLPRQFQYEKTQSRIGETLWKAPMRYIENSPIFMADRVETPLLMIHNDQDDAVPWYQGIEYFLALRRLGKECYLLNYNGEKHNLGQKANARDFAGRMFQFFEHHLRGRTAPPWMVSGVPYTDRARAREQPMAPAGP